MPKEFGSDSNSVAIVAVDVVSKTTIGPVNVALYAFWQTTDTTGAAVASGESSRRSSSYALVPEVKATTKYGKYYVRFYSEFGVSNTPQGNVVMVGVVFGKPSKTADHTTP
jgi:hypothetical protein